MGFDLFSSKKTMTEQLERVDGREITANGKLIKYRLKRAKDKQIYWFDLESSLIVVTSIVLIVSDVLSIQPQISKRNFIPSRKASTCYL